jgi:hypothetical protein
MHVCETYNINLEWVVHKVPVNLQKWLQLVSNQLPISNQLQRNLSQHPRSPNPPRAQQTPQKLMQLPRSRLNQHQQFQLRLLRLSHLPQEHWTQEAQFLQKKWASTLTRQGQIRSLCCLI